MGRTRKKSCCKNVIEDNINVNWHRSPEYS